MNKLFHIIGLTLLFHIVFIVVFPAQTVLSPKNLFNKVTYSNILSQASNHAVNKTNGFIARVKNNSQRKTPYTSKSEQKQILATSENSKLNKSSKPLFLGITIKNQQTLTKLLIGLLIILIIVIILILRQRNINKKQNRLLQRQNNQIRTKNDELQEANNKLTKQKEEIEAQRDEILKQRNQLEKQYELIETKSWEISNSFQYASHIQSTILPNQEELSSYFQDYFILIRPKNMVSGDFYWFTKKEEKIIVAAADCTGHGVAGGLMSMLGVNLLHEIVKDKHIVSPDQILNELRRLVISALEQEEHDSVISGMDMALITYTPEDNLLEFAGANNPLYIIRDDKLSEYAPDKMPLSLYSRMDGFSKHLIEVKKGDQIYLFSDGFTDQFGGEHQKKFKFRPFRKLIVENNHKQMEEQKSILNNTFEAWKGDLEQVDDVLVMGIKL
jgi:serine phosphatase RsbU (regulator of sigma subunit)